MDTRSADIDTLFPERAKHKSTVSKLNFDLINIFILRATEYYEDIVEIHKEFASDLMVADFAFTAIPYVAEKMNIPVKYLTTGSTSAM